MLDDSSAPGENNPKNLSESSQAGEQQIVLALVFFLTFATAYHFFTTKKSIRFFCLDIIHSNRNEDLWFQSYL